ncbi:phospholipid:diacylglycerol acyltransferase [Mycena rosella]|uniref:Phospholipid:diacylglycerol acyltransferase n=1 Tax=Mycena rosella TaxID=1033263 RepID=A0AAD7DFV2_MYCRO|nr:phospholipid:diacylglycerol acyltransferase [Mycena rosella]
MVLVKRAKTWADSDSATVAVQPEELAETANVLKAEVSKLKKPRPLFASRRVLFPLGIILGALIAFSLIEPRDIQDLHAHLTLLLGEYELSMPGLDLSRVETEWQRLRSNIPEVWKFNMDGREFQVGEAMRDRGLTAQHPVVLIPGIISTALESWSTEPEYRGFFRQKMWGGFNMISQVTFNRENWLTAMMLDPVTGLDPPGAKIRAAEGIDAASSFIPGYYWIWSKIVENLAVVNYDTSTNLHLAAYDWRLSPYNLEERDGYFSRLKSTIEGFKRRQNKKTVIVAHSMGSTVVLYFFKWVESPEHGGGGPDWVENHIEAYISIGGTHLGVAKAMTAFLSGETRDTVQISPAGTYVLERFVSRAERQKLFRSWAGSASMWIKGGNAIWGTPHGAPDDGHNCTHTHGDLIAFRVPQPQPEAASTSAGLATEAQNMTADAAGAWILQHTPSSFQKMMATNYSFGIERDEAVLEANNGDHTKWTNPLEVQLPRAPSMKMYCVYGHGKETERSYWYAQGANEYDETADSADGSDPLCVDPIGGACVKRSAFDTPLARKSWIDAEYTDEGLSPRLLNGVNLGEGDGTVNLVSLGAMCAEGWKRARYNPAGIQITTIELPHQPAPSMPRGGANTSEHVDILGSTGLNEIIIKVATGVGHELVDSYVSNIREYARKMHWDVD